MSAARARRRGVLLLLVFAAALAGLVWLGSSGAGAAGGGGELSVQAYAGAPTQTFLGASPLEAPGEAWAEARTPGGGIRTLARYTDAAGWEIVPEPVAAGGGSIEGLSLLPGAAAGRTTPRGGIAVAAESGADQLVVVRDPGGALREAADPTGVLEPEQPIFGKEGEPVLAVAEEPDGSTGVYVAPPSGGAMLAYAAGEWTSEPICIGVAPVCEAPAFGFEPIAVDAAEGEAWLLAAVPGEGIALFRRESGGSPVWQQQELGPPGSVGARFAEAKPLGVEVEPRRHGQPLTVTGKGVWFDAELTGSAGEFDATGYYDDAEGEVTGTWCDLGSPAGLCGSPLGSELQQGEGRSFAWPPSGGSGPFGTRVLTGIGTGAILTLEGTAFRRQGFIGADAGAALGAALASPEEGWLGATPPLQLTRTPLPASLQPWPVPFKRPLTAIVSAPGSAVGALGTEALAVGDEGEVARYVPGKGWEPEFLLRSSGKRATPTLRGVAWPEPGLAYAVGDGNAMWRWQQATGLWQPDPGAPPNLARANFTGIAFDPSQPSRGYAIGKQGVLLGFGRQWTQEPLPAAVPPEANFTSIAFAGQEAIATWKYPEKNKAGKLLYHGGVIVNSGSGWQVEAAADEALGEATPQRVAGLPDGGAAIASLAFLEGGGSTAGVVLERQGPGAPWQAAAGGSPGFPTALAAVREGGQVRAVMSVLPRGVQQEEQGNLELRTDAEQAENQPAAGQAPLLTEPYPLPGAGVLMRQTAVGWRDDQRQSTPLPAQQTGRKLYDLPFQPDPVLALMLSPSGGEGWAVGGETASNVVQRAAALKTAAAMRYGTGAAPPSNAAAAPIATEAGTATFALGADAQCAGPCADFYPGAGIGPERWLRAAVGTAAAISGMRAFLYAGDGVAAGEGTPLAETIGQASFQREEEAYARRLGGSAPLPTFAAPAESDLDATRTLTAFSAAFAGFGAPLGSAPPAAGISPVSQAVPGQAYYAFDSAGGGGSVRVIVLDYSQTELGEPQRCWLAQQLSGARLAGLPSLVVGERDLAGLAPNKAADRTRVVQTLAGGGGPVGCVLPGSAGIASAYLFDYPEQNRDYSLRANGRSVPAYGSGTLGYVQPPLAANTEFAGASGFLLVSVNVAAKDPTTAVAPVSARLTPSIGSLALNATDGTLLRRSQPALFEALARRVQAGSSCQGNAAPLQCDIKSPEQYVPIPSQCRGPNCATTLLPEYSFTSSEPDIADFVSSDPASTNPRNVLLVEKKPVLDSHSGLLCAFNAGTTTVTVTAGGLSYSQKVTVLAGSVQQPCGTTPLRNRGAVEPDVGAPPPPAAAPSTLPTNPAPLPPPPPPPTQTPPPAVAKQPLPKPPPQPAPTTFFSPAQAAAPIVPIVPPPPLPAVQPTPPSGTSQVQATEKEEEEEEAYDTVASMVALPERGPARTQASLAAAPGEGSGGVPLLVPALVLIAAIAAAGIGGSRRRRDRRPAFQANTDWRFR